MLQSFVFGLQDVLIPFNGTSLLIFFLVLSLYGKTQLRRVVLGLIFCVSLFAGIFLSHLGYYDAFLSDNQVLSIIQFCYFLVGLFCVFIGIMHFIDWYRLKRGSSESEFMIPKPAFCIDPSQVRATSKASKIRFILICFLVYFLSSSLAIFSGAWQDNIVFTFFSFMISQQDWAFIRSVYLFYILGLSCPFFGLWFFVLGFQKYCLKNFHFSLFKIVLSALFLSVGNGLVLAYFL